VRSTEILIKVLSEKELSKTQEILEATLADSRRRKNILTLCWTTGLLVFLNLCTWELLARFVVFAAKPPYSSNPQYDSKYLVAKTLRQCDDNIILCGDSLMKQGIYPELLSSKLHKVNEHIRVVNLAVNGGSQSDAIKYLDFVQARGIKPRLVIFDYEVAMSANEKSPAADPTHLDGYLLSGLLSRPHDFVQQCELVFSDCSFLVRQRGGIKHLLLDFLSSLPNARLFEQQSIQPLTVVTGREISESGMAPEFRLSSENDSVNQRRFIEYNSYERSPKSGHFIYNTDSYLQIIRYCQKHELPLVLTWLPHQVSVYDKYWYSAPYTESWFKQNFDNLEKEKFVFPLYINNFPEDPAFYFDYRHLSNYGCVKATELMADSLVQPKFRNLLVDFRLLIKGRNAPKQRQ
jgi:hypothetical protein